jgi:hypothetical protein
MKLQSWMKVLKLIGFKDCLNYQFPKLADPHYINGWLEALGMMHGYKNILPLIADENYFDGYEQAQSERKTSGEQDIREVLW